uniref:translation initiation factor IF-2-like isoform X2 n=1 Tax=Nyctereutes procyonoides TaxID=34880 RepID=UPI0024443BDA|nr:translation initiation factor IF-2-like isoform X2 [Nyctereutes procyonoides]
MITGTSPSLTLSGKPPGKEGTPGGRARALSDLGAQPAPFLDLPPSFTLERAVFPGPLPSERALVPLGRRDLDSVAGTVETPERGVRSDGVGAPSLQPLRELHFQPGRSGSAPPPAPVPGPRRGGEAGGGWGESARSPEAAPCRSRPGVSAVASRPLAVPPGLARFLPLSPAAPRAPRRARRRWGGRRRRRRAEAGRRRPRSPRSSRAGSGAHRLQAAAVGGAARLAGLVGRPRDPPAAARARLCRALPARGRRRAGRRRAAGSGVGEQRAGLRGRLTWARRRPGAPGAQGLRRPRGLRLQSPVFAMLPFGDQTRFVGVREKFYTFWMLPTLDTPPGFAFFMRHRLRSRKPWLPFNSSVSL